MPRTIKMFCIRMNISSHRNNIVMFLACNMAAMQNLYSPIFIAVCLVSKPLYRSEARVDFAVIQTLLLFVYVNHSVIMPTSLHLYRVKISLNLALIPRLGYHSQNCKTVYWW